MATAPKFPAESAPAAAPRRGRYELSLTTQFGTVTERYDDLDAARWKLEQFSREHAGDRSAQAGIYDYRVWKYVAGWSGCEKVGPRDTRHPMERMIRRAVTAGHKVSVSEGLL